jgi:hypothetical protein
MPDVGGSNLLHVELPWPGCVTYTVVDGEAIDMRVARGHGRCLVLGAARLDHPDYEANANMVMAAIRRWNGEAK